MTRPPDNREVAEVLERVADLLEAQDANPFRVRAYRTAAKLLRRRQEPVAERLATTGIAGLRELPGIGESLAASIQEYVATGRLRLLDRLEGEVAPEDLFTTVPGIGEDLAHRIHAELGVETLEELELAAHDGRLEAIAGFGERRTRLVRDALGAILSRSSRRRGRLIRAQEAAESAVERPSVAMLLAVDEEYRRRAGRGELRTIAPRRFNPDHEAWLPVLHAERDHWSITAMFSNTARAHALDKTRDWVVLYYERDGHEGQCTVVTEGRGGRAGRRVVRGREAECEFVAAAPESPIRS
jgi:hypothetical protein